MKRILLLLLFSISVWSAFAQSYGNAYFKSTHMINSDSTHGELNGTEYMNSNGLLRFKENGVWRYRLGTTAPLTASQIPYVTSGNLVTGESQLTWNSTYNRLVAGDNITISGAGLTPVGGGQSIFVGEDISISSDHSWSAVFGWGHTLSAVYNNGLMGGSGHTLESGPVGTTAIFGSGHTITGGAYKLHSLVSGIDNTINTTTTGVTNSSNGNFMYGSSNTISGGIIRNAFVGGNLSTASASNAFVHGYPISSQTTRPIIASGINAVNISANSTSQTSAHGALANYSVILGGQDHNIPDDSPGSVILGGNAIKARATDPDQVYVPNLNIDEEPSNDDALTQVLVRDGTTGEIKYRASSSIGGGAGITNGAAANELMKSDGTNAVASGIFSSVSGDVDFGTTSITGSRTLQVRSSTSDANFHISAQNNGHIWLETEGNKRLKVSVNGVGIGNAGEDFTPSSALDIRDMSSATGNNIQTVLTLTRGTTGTPATGIGGAIDFKIETASSNEETGVKIEAVTTDVTSASEDVDIVFKNMSGGSSAAEKFRITSAGNATLVGTGTGVDWVATSDRRLKYHFKSVDSQLRKISAISDLVTNYDRKDNGRNEIGFVAQELLKVAPEYVVSPRDTASGYYAVNYAKMTPILFKGVDELQEEVSELRQEVAELKAIIKEFRRITLEASAK